MKINKGLVVVSSEGWMINCFYYFSYFRCLGQSLTFSLTSTPRISLIYFCGQWFCLFSRFGVCASRRPMGHTDPVYFYDFANEDAGGALKCWPGKRSASHDTFARGSGAMTQSLGDLTAGFLSTSATGSYLYRSHHLQTNASNDLQCWEMI